MGAGLVLSSHRQCQALMDLVRSGYASLPELGRPESVPAGRELVTGIHGPGDLFGPFCLCQQQERNERAVALEAATVVPLDVEALLSLAATREGALVLLQLFCQRISDLEAQLSQLAFAKVRTRLALLLLRLAEEGEPLEGGFRLCREAPTHEEMAHRIGSTREQVSTLLARLRRDGLIRYGRGRPLEVHAARLRQALERM